MPIKLSQQRIEKPALNQALPGTAILIEIRWRTERDSNPRDGYPPTRVPGVRLQPLGHLSFRTAANTSEVPSAQGLIPCLFKPLGRSAFWGFAGIGPPGYL